MGDLRTLLALGGRGLLAAVFLWAGLVKVGDRQSFVLAVDGFRLLPRELVMPFAAALPWIELSIGLFLALGLFVRFSAVVSAGLLVVFLVALVQAKARGLAIDCGCFGAAGPNPGITWWEIGRDIPLLAAALHLARWPAGPFQLDGRVPAVGDS